MNRRAIAAAQAVVTMVLLVVLFRGFDWAAFRTLYRSLLVVPSDSRRSLVAPTASTSFCAA